MLHDTMCCSAGILLWSIALIQEGHDLAAALCFAVLLNMKHLFAALAPLYFVYLLRHYCRCESSQKSVVTHTFIIQKPLQTHDICMLSVSSLHCHVCPLLQHTLVLMGLRWRSEGCCMMEEPQADKAAQPSAEAGKLVSQLAGVLAQGTCGASEVPCPWSGDCSCVSSLIWAIHSSRTGASGDSHTGVLWKGLHQTQELAGAFSGSPLHILCKMLFVHYRAVLCDSL